MSDQIDNFCTEIRERIARVVVGQEVVVERVLISLFTGGHLLLQGMPGLAKTLLINAVAAAIDLKYSRIQFTIDMLPSDVVGSEILDQGSGEFRTHQGPVFTNLLLADEINRAAPKVQSALLEAMQERKVTIGKTTYRLPLPFLVIATQNPVEQSGTFELPEAQLDRFMLYHRLTYNTAEEELEIMNRQLEMGLKKDEAGGAVPMTAFDSIEQDPYASTGQLVEIMEAVQRVHVGEICRKHCIAMIRRTREHPHLEFGCSPRAQMALTQASRARAFIHGRDYVVPEDLFALAEDVIAHRVRLTYEALAEGHTSQDVLQDIMENLD